MAKRSVRKREIRRKLYDDLALAYERREHGDLYRNRGRRDEPAKEEEQQEDQEEAMNG